MIKLFSRILKRPSLAKSVVGLALKLFGGEMVFPLYFPLIIRNGIGLIDSHYYVEVDYQMYNYN